MSRRLTVVRPGLPLPPSTTDDEVFGLTDFRAGLAAGRLLARIARYREGRILVARLSAAGRPLPLALAVRLLTRGAVFVEDLAGERRVLSASVLAAWSARLAAEPFRVAGLLHRIEAEVAGLESLPARSTVSLRTGSPLYLRTDLSTGIRAGGSVSHIAGVLNELPALIGAPIFLTTDEVPTVDSSIEAHTIAPREAFWNFRELPTLVLNDAVDEVVGRVTAGRSVAFVYQRYSLNNYAGLRVARARGVPFVLEYNGSEIWMSRHWGRPLKYDAIAGRIERLNLLSADLVVVVSRAMREEAAARGVSRERILVNPNGVDASRYHPDVDGHAVRARYGFQGRTVVGFIGTFGPWHGAEVLARAFATMIQERPALRPSTRLLMIGDGEGLPAARRLIAEGGAADTVAWTGLVPQEQGPGHLAACDLLVSPHVPNPDGTPFFGSPTKLFEYMAMGKGIVASDLNQIGEVLQHGRTGWLVPPGDVSELAEAIGRLVIDRDLRCRLGREARQEVLAHHTWRHHARRTVERLQVLGQVSDERPRR